MDDISGANKEILSVEEVAEYLRVGPVTIYRWCREGRLPCLKIGKHWRIRQAALEGFLERSERPPTLARELRSFLNVLPMHVAVIDGSGAIVAVSQTWRDFAKSNGASGNVSEGANYLWVCDAATGEQSEYAAAFAEGIRSVFSRDREEFALEYPCHSPTEWRWFVGHVKPVTNGDPLRAVIAHENITERKRLEEQLTHN